MVEKNIEVDKLYMLTGPT